MVERQQQERFHELRLDGGCADGHDRLAREDRRALGHRPDIARKAEIAQIAEEILAENAAAAKIGNVVLVKMELLDIPHRLLQTGRNGEAAVVRHRPEKHVKVGDPILIAALEITVSHRQLIKIAEHGQIRLFVRVHKRTSASL